MSGAELNKLKLRVLKTIMGASTKLIKLKLLLFTTNSILA